jgi:hypothetical protein
MKWVVHVARIEAMNIAYKMSVVKPEGKNNPEDLSIDERLILKWILRK